MTALLPLCVWIPILDGDDAARELFEAHYSAQRNLSRRRERGTRLFVGPGEKLVLATPCRRALFAWRRERFRKDGQSGVECAVFSNRGAGLSSELIRAADLIADRRWPGLRHFTFVDANAILSPNPGFCFKVAGWQTAGVSKSRGLIILERTP